VALVKGVRGLGAENERLKEHQTKTTRAWRKSEERERALAAENKRLRAPLKKARQKIVDLIHDIDAALAGGKGEEQDG